MSNNGYIKLPRSVLRDPLWFNMPPNYQHVFFVILENLCYRPQKFDDGGHIIDLKPGQLCISERELKKKCNRYVSRDDVKRSIKKLVQYQFLHQEVHHKKSVLTVIHPDICEYMKNECAPSSAPVLHQSCTNLAPETNKVNTDKKVNKDNAQSSRADPTSHRIDICFNFETRAFENIHDLDLANWKELYPAVDVNRELLAMVDWCLSNSSKAKSKKLWRKFIANWLRTSNETAVNRAAYQARNGAAVDRRTKDMEGKPVDNPMKGIF